MSAARRAGGLLMSVAKTPWYGSAAEAAGAEASAISTQHNVANVPARTRMSRKYIRRAQRTRIWIDVPPFSGPSGRRGRTLGFRAMEIEGSGALVVGGASG